MGNGAALLREDLFLFQWPESKEQCHLGNIEILSGRPIIGLFCSSKCPGKLILDTYDFMQKFRDAGMTLIGGFHSPMEQECLKILLRSPYPVILCPARGIPNRFPPQQKTALDQGRLLILTPFPATVTRVSEETSAMRNLFVARQAHAIFIAHAASGSKIEHLFAEIKSWNKRVFTIEDEQNSNLLTRGAVGLKAAEIGRGAIFPHLNPDTGT